jgi:ribosomal protein S18 acetylase RimI-like enzyme
LSSASLPPESNAPIARRATPEDAPALRTLVRAAYFKWVLVIGREPKPMTADYDKAVREHLVFVVDGPGRLDAAIELIPGSDHLLVENVAVAVAAQGRGLGSQLMEVAERVAKDLGVEEMRLYTNARFAANITLYEKLGYTITERAAIPTGGEVVWMRKRLGATAAPNAIALPESLHVPLWRDGAAPLGRIVLYRAVWVALAIIVAVGTLSTIVFSGGALTSGHIATPAALCAAAAVFALWQFWLIVAAARRTMRAGGSVRSSGLAITGAILGALVIAGILHGKAVPQLLEMWDIYRGDDKMNDLLIAVLDDGRTMVLDGTLGMGAAARVKGMLDAHPTVRTVVMEGPGGRMGPAYEIYQLIRARKLDTRVERECDSACTVMFLGGVRRSLGPFGRLGFHQVSFPGMSRSDMADANRQLRNFLILEVKISGPFVRKVTSTPPDSIWSPTPQELLEAGVIHASDAPRK